MERLCDDLIIVSRGRVVAAGSVEDLRRAEGEAWALHVGADADLDWVPDIAGVRVLDLGRDGADRVVVFETDRAGAEQEVLRAALGRGAVRELRRRTPTLAEIFREVAA